MFTGRNDVDSTICERGSPVRGLGSLPPLFRLPTKVIVFEGEM